MKVWSNISSKLGQMSFALKTAPIFYKHLSPARLMEHRFFFWQVKLGLINTIKIQPFKGLLRYTNIVSFLDS